MVHFYVNQEARAAAEFEGIKMIFFKDTTDKNEDKIKKMGEKLLQGEVRSLAWLYEEIAVRDAKITNRVADYIKTYMSGLNAGQLIHLNESFREITSMDWVIDWKNVNLDHVEKQIKDKEAFLWVARLGTFHPNGFFREKCIRRLLNDKESVAFIILRLNDWTRVIRTLAANVTDTFKILSIDEIFGVLPFLSKVENGNRRDSEVIRNINECISDRVKENLSTYDLGKIKSFEMAARRRIYKLFLENKLIDCDAINKLISNEKNCQLQVCLLSCYINNYDISMEELDEYIDHKSEVVQKFAIEYKSHITHNSWDGLEEKLISKSAGLRSSVRFILQMKSSVDIRQFYLDRLDTEARNICILGLGENGNENDADVLMRFLESDDAGVVKRTLHAIGMLKREKAADIFWKYLQDKRLSVMCQAYREIMANDIRYGAKDIYELFTETDPVELKRKLAAMLVKEKYWDRLPYIILLYSHEDEIIRNKIRIGLNGVSMYGTILKENADWVRALLSDSSFKIPERTKQNILLCMKYACKE